MAKYKYFTDEKNRMVIAVSSYAKKRVKGVAIAAFSRAWDKYSDALELYNYALKYLDRMKQYLNDSFNEKTEADQRVQDVLDELT